VPAATNGPTRSRPPVRQPSIRLATPDETVAPSTPGHEWRRVDLHIHTPASVDYQQPEATPLDILRRAAEQALDVVAFTDHNSVRGYADMWREIEDLELLEYLKRLNPEEAERLKEYRRLLDQILVLPGFEFTATFGFHILAIFPEGTSVRLMEHLLLLLGVPEETVVSAPAEGLAQLLRREGFRSLDEAVGCQAE